MPSGGARTGAGRKKKAAEVKILEGNRGKRDIEVLQFSRTAPTSQRSRPNIFRTPPRRFTNRFWHGSKA
jgi:hypothetical protein